MSQHPAPNVPIAEPEIRATDPAPAPDLAALRAAIEAAGWDERDRLMIRDRAIWLDCICCGNANGVTHPVAIWADGIANLIVQATNSLPALLAEIEALRNDLAAKRSDFDAACARLGELEAAQPDPAGYVVGGWQHDGAPLLQFEAAHVDPFGDRARAYATRGEAKAFAAKCGPYDPRAEFKVYGLHEVSER